MSEGDQDGLRGTVGALLNVDHDHFDRLFALLLVAFIGLLLADTFQYSDDGRLFPLVIGVPTLLLLVGLLAVQLSPRLGEAASRYASSELFEVDDVVDEFDETGGDAEGRTLQEERTDVVLISLWTLALFGVVMLIGFLPGTLVFLLGYYRLQADQSWLRTVAFSLTMWLFVIVIFEFVLNTPFYTGVLGVELPFLS